MPDNSVTLIGNVIRPPEMRYTTSGMPSTTLGLAVSRRWQNKQSNEWEEQTSFFDCVAYGSTAENICSSVDKGTRVILSGRMEQRSWEDKESGAKRSKVEVLIDDIGPSLRWAEAEVTRNPKKEGGSYSGGGSSGNSGGGQRQAASAGAGYDDESPF